MCDSMYLFRELKYYYKRYITGFLFKQKHLFNQCIKVIYYISRQRELESV